MVALFDKDLTGATRTGDAGAVVASTGAPAEPPSSGGGITELITRAPGARIFYRLPTGSGISPDITGSARGRRLWIPWLRPGVISPTRAQEQVVPELTILADASSDVDQTGARGNWITHAVGVQTTLAQRTYLRFPLASIAANAQIAAVVLRANASFQTGNESDTYIGGPYNGNGQGDPAADTGLQAYARCEVSADFYFDADTALRTTGIKTWDLGAGAIADLNAARLAGATYFSVALRQTDETLGSSHYAGVDGFTEASPPALILTLTTASAVLITDAEDELVSDGETDFTVSGQNFGAAQGGGTVELNTDADGSGVAVLQTVTSWSANSIVITIVRGSHSDGTLYLVVRTDAGLRSNGWPVTLAAGAAAGVAGWWAVSGTVGVFDAKTVDDYLTDVNMAALTGAHRIGVGDVRLPVRTAFAQIRNVSVAFLSVGTQWTYRVLDRDTDIGPRIQTYDNGVLADATIDARVSGLK